MNRVLSFPQSHSCDDPAEVVSKRFCFSCIFSVSFLSLILGYLLGARQTQINVPVIASVRVNHEIFSSLHLSSNKSDIPVKIIGLTNYDEILMLRDHFINYKFDEISPILKSNVTLTFKNKDIPDTIKIIVNNGEIRYQNIRNASYTYVIPEEVQDIKYLTNCVSGLPVYGNFGLEEDFKLLVKQGILFNDSIILLRLGKISILEKVSEAFKRGVKGVLLFPDPQQYPGMDCLFVNEEISPILLAGLLEDYGSCHPDCNSNCGIPVQIIEPMTAKNILLKMATINKSPDQWHGSLGTLYSIGPGFDENGSLVMYSYFIHVRYTIYDIAAYLRSTQNSDRYIMLTNSRKTLSSEKKNYESTNALLEVSKTLAKMKTDEGWKPSRTLVFCSFGLEDIENYSADSWSQKYLDIIKQRSVVYLNIKEPIQKSFSFQKLNAEISPLLENLFSSCVSKIADSSDEERKLLFDIRHSSKKNFIKSYARQYMCDESNRNSSLDSEIIFKSNFNDEDIGTKFFKSLGIPIITFWYDNQSSNQKRNTDMKHFVNVHEYEKHIIQLWALLTFSLSNTLILPFNVTSYFSILKNLNDRLIRCKLFQYSFDSDDFGKLNYFVTNLTFKIEQFQDKIQSFSDHNLSQYRMINDKLMQMERLFTCVEIAFDTMLNTINKISSTEIKIMKKLLKKGLNCVAEIDYLITDPYY
ncbi:hypothetical protein PGB90_002231 [Kerria lacca]